MTVGRKGEASISADKRLADGGSNVGPVNGAQRCQRWNLLSKGRRLHSNTNGAKEASSAQDRKEDGDKVQVETPMGMKGAIATTEELRSPVMVGQVLLARLSVEAITKGKENGEANRPEGRIVAVERLVGMRYG